MTKKVRQQIKPDRLPGHMLYDLLQEYGLSGEEAARVAGELLHYKPGTIKSMYSRTVHINDYELLQYKLYALAHEK